MNPPDFNQDQLLALIAEVLDGSLDDCGRESLNEILRTSPEALQFFREHMELHARLHLDYTAGEVTQFLPRSQAQQNSRFVFPRIVAVVLAAAACIALAAVLLWSPRQANAHSFATLKSSSAARWVGSDLPTKDGTRLGKGTLRLAEGVGTLIFDSGAKISLEAPVELTLVDKMNCKLDSGIAVADVPHSAIGFRITTPEASVVDYGTRFSVLVDKASGRTRTQVYEGLVEIEHISTGRVATVKAGQMIIANQNNLGDVIDGHEATTWPEIHGSEVRESEARGPEWSLLETSEDGYIGGATDKGVKVPRSETLLLVKKSVKGAADRRAYLGFDLSGYDKDSIKEAELMLHFAPTNLGLASDVPDATFSVYGVVEDEPWTEKTLREKNLPAHYFRAPLDPKKYRKLDSFIVSQGVQTGQFGIQGTELVDFLREFAGSTVTLIVIRDTMETQTTGLVHGFASLRHPTLPAPTLAIRRSE